jgi:ribulose-5-phosphate 4-epimerase/fuculose-1-phosphate aldolase
MNAPEKLPASAATGQIGGNAMDNGPFKLSFQPPVFASLEDQRLHRKQRLAASFRLFSKFGFDEGVAGHITVRDPIEPDTFWVNAFGIHFSQITVSNLIRVNDKGETIDGAYPVNAAAYAIHSRIHKARPDVVAAAHSHSLHGKAFSALGTLLTPITQDACAFYGDHALYGDFGGVVVELDEGDRVAKALGNKKAVILQNHGLLTVGETVDAAAWWFITMERTCQAELLARAAGSIKTIRTDAAEQAFKLTGNPLAGWFQFQPLYARIAKEQPDFLN